MLMCTLSPKFINQNQHSYNLDEVKKEVTFLGKKEQVCTDMYSFHFIAQI